MRAAAASALLLTLVLSSSVSSADPQLSAGVTTGFALTDLRASNGPRAAYTLGGRFDFLFGRSAPRDMAVGPYLEILTTAFDSIEGGGGVAWLVPTGSTGFVFSAGAFARSTGWGVEPGGAATIFWGSRSFNYHSAYTVSAGLFAQGRYGLGGSDISKQADVLFGAQIDLEYVALPFVFAYQAIVH